MIAAGLGGVGGDHVLQRHAEVHDLGHHVEDVLHAGVLAAGVQVGADDVGEEALLGGRHGLPPQEAAAAVADVEDHAALAGRDDVRLDLPLLVDDRIAPAHVTVHVREDVTRPQVLVEEVVERQRREVAAEVDHHRHLGLRAGLDGAVDRVPVAAVVVGHLDPDDQALVQEDAHRRQAGVHVGQVLLGRPALHPRADDVDEGEDARLRRVDDVGLELAEVAPAGAADVDQRGLAAAERVAVGQDRRQPVAQVGVGLGAVEHVGVQVDEPGHDVQARRIDDAARLGGVDRRRDLGDLAGGDGDVHEAVAPVLRVDDVTALDEDGVRRLRGRGCRPQDGDAPEGGEQQGS